MTMYPNVGLLQNHYANKTETWKLKSPLVSRLGRQLKGAEGPCRGMWWGPLASSNKAVKKSICFIYIHAAK